MLIVNNNDTTRRTWISQFCSSTFEGKWKLDIFPVVQRCYPCRVWHKNAVCKLLFREFWRKKLKLVTQKVSSNNLLISCWYSVSVKLCICDISFEVFYATPCVVIVCHALYSSCWTHCVEGLRLIFVFISTCIFSWTAAIRSELHLDSCRHFCAWRRYDFLSTTSMPAVTCCSISMIWVEES